jgi:hypothetical protein
MKKKFKSATVMIVDEKSIIAPDDNLISELKMVEDWIGGKSISFNSVKVKIKFEVK